MAEMHATFQASATSNIQLNSKEKNVMKKKLTLSSNKMIGGVCGGLAEYFDVDPTVFRVLYAIATVFTAFSGLILYLVLWMIIPKK